ncbi:MAG: MFS transporter [Verrucomicrobia subdivision 3 bacterium]|nr:MFS transporter [Limisphaerales bacterium]
MNETLDTPSPPRVQSAAPRIAWTVVAILMAFCFISHMNRVSMSIAADEQIMAEYNIMPTEMGRVYSAFLLVYTLFMIPGGLFIDRFGVRVALAVMGFATAAFGALTGLSGFFAAANLLLALLVVRAVMGFFTTPLHPGCARAVALWTAPGRRSFANGLVTGAALLGVACTPPVFGALMDSVGWQAAFLVTAGLTALIAVAWWAVTARARSAVVAPAAYRRAIDWKLLTSRNVVLLTLSYSAIGYFQYLFFYWMHYYFDHVLRLGKTESRLYAALPVLTMALAMPVGGWLSDRLQTRYGWRPGRAFVAGASMLGAALFLAFGVITAIPEITVAAFTLALGTLGVSESAFWNTAAETGAEAGATAAAVMNTGGNGIGLLAPLATPWIAELLGWRSGIAVGGIICLLGAVCWLWIRPDSANEMAAEQ